jgi:predicted SprT family Zn-dependent metalloprotease
MSLAIRSTATTSKCKEQINLDELFKSADGKGKVGCKPYWQHAVTVKAHNKKKVLYQCKLCGKRLSTRNPRDSVASHVVFTADGATCKAQLSHQSDM